ncbi:ABC transporter permease [Lacticigenium naphthae]|uniref:ABC transporter permease n=1 Tax=Lacticigenium naphthae TaxID=515351 RepID=UPI00041BA90B|nr:ABC transporter permease [Lacticigenium naphthae]
MNKKTLWKDTWREITNTKTRFLSIFAITLLGTAFFAGISATGPDMLDTARTYYAKYELMDLRVQSSLGLASKDEEVLANIPDATLQTHFTQDVIISDTGDAVKLFSFNSSAQEINQYSVEEGKLPTKVGEIALDASLENQENFIIGETLSFKTEDIPEDPTENLNYLSYEIVGFIKSPLYIENIARGNTQVGSGSLDGFGVIHEDNFSMDVKTEAFIQFDQPSESQLAYSTGYEESIEKKQAEIEKQLEPRQAGRQQEIRDEIQEEITKGQNELNEAKEELENAEKELQDAREELDQGWQDYEDGMDELENERDAGQTELDQGKVQIEENKRELDQQESELNQALAEIESGREELEETKLALGGSTPEIQQLEEELNAREISVRQGLNQIQQGKAEILQREQELTNAQAQLNFEIAQAKTELENARQDLEEGEQEYSEGKAEFDTEAEEARIEISEAEEDLEKAREEMADVPEAEFYVLDRTSNPGYSEFEDNSNRIASIAQVFPVFFFLLAALISLTTMTRMVDEGRNHIGTLKALGYSNGAIATKYFVYAFVATIMGSLIGLGIGYYLFPSVIFDAYGSLYNLPSVEINFFLNYSLISVFGALLATGGATIVAVRVALRANAATLLRPKAPKKGKRIFLERIPFIWNHLSFTRKVAARNLFRYKRRMLMTIFGVAGCTGLILTGFGLSDSISDIADLQYGKINQYDAIVALNTDATEEELTEYEEKLNQNDSFEEKFSTYQNSITIENETETNQEGTLIVPKNPNDLSQFISLSDIETDEEYELTTEGVLISQKIAELHGYSKGDELTITNADNQATNYQIEGIFENYLGHLVYVHPTLYNELNEEEPEWNTDLLLLNDNVNEDELGESISSLDSILGITFISMVSDVFIGTLDSLGVVTIVLIVSAASLAFVVLYNLTNINVSERIRELSTIKVLGFYDKEVTLYIYRENLMLTLMGTVAGLGLGVLLHQYVLKTAELDQMMFSRIINYSSFIYSSILTFLFSSIVMIAMHYKLKHVDMIEALKTID